MGSRKSSFKQGGGFLNGVDGAITDYQFSDEFNGVPFEPGKIKDSRTGKLVDKPHSLNCALSIRLDGAGEDVTTTLRVAKNADDWDVSEDGHTLTSIGTVGLGGSSAFGKFITSWEAASGVGAESDAHGEAFNYEPIIGSRVRFVQREYSAEELKAIEKLGASAKRKGKDGKEYARQSLVVEQVHELAQPAAKSNGRTKTVVASASSTKGRGQTKNTADTELADLALSTLQDILSEADDNSIPKAKLRMRVFAKLGTKHPQRDEVIKYLYDDTNLAEMDGIAYEPSDKSQLISLA